MGWSSGSFVFNAIMSAVQAEVPNKEARKRIYIPIIEGLRDFDWDTEDECVGEDEAYDELYEEMYPDEGL